jgi:hypothetical protein
VSLILFLVTISIAIFIARRETDSNVKRQFDAERHHNNIRLFGFDPDEN